MRPTKGEALISESLAGESKEGFRTSDLFKRLQRYGSAKVNQLEFRQYLGSVGETGLADDLGGCGNYMALRDYFTIGQTRLAKICTCKRHLICPLCAIRRGAKSVRVYKEKVDELLRRNPRLRPYLVTFTVKNGADLDERFHHLTSCLRMYHRRRSRLNTSSEILKASAAVWSYEFTNNRTVRTPNGFVMELPDGGTGWHPHVHSIWLCEEAPDMYRLRDEWKAITGDSFMVDVSPMDEADPIGAFCEVFKYAVKFADLADPDRLHAYRTLKGKRLQGSFGELRGLDVEPSDSDELLDDLPYIERLYQFIPGVGYKLTGESNHNPKTEDDRMLEALISMGWSDEQIVAFMRDRGERHAA